MKRLILGLGLLCVSATSQADAYGLVNGRTADVVSEPQMTVEGGLSFEGDLTTLGGQVNFKTSPNMLIYGSLANVDPDFGGAEIGFGGGVVYQFNQPYLANLDTAVKGSYHLVSFGATDLSDFGVELLVSPVEQNAANGMKLFGMLGMHRLAASNNAVSDDNIELTFGGGAILPLGIGEAYATLEHIDTLFIGFGYRLAVGQ